MSFTYVNNFFAATKWICWKHWVSVGHIVFLFHNFSSIEICSPTDVKRSHNRRRSMFSRQKVAKRDRGNEESKKDWKAFLVSYFLSFFYDNSNGFRCAETWHKISLGKWTRELVSLWWAVLPIKVLYYSQEGDFLQIEFMEIFFLAWKWKLSNLI